MTDTVLLSAGTRVYIAADTPATYDAAGFSALSWTEVGDVESIGEFGGTANIASFTPLGTGVARKRKGSLDYGTMSMVAGRVLSDAGQVLAKDGFDGTAKYDVHACKVVESSGMIMYFTGVISSFSSQINDANSVTKVAISFDLDNYVLYDDSGSSSGS